MWGYIYYCNCNQLLLVLIVIHCLHVWLYRSGDNDVENSSNLEEQEEGAVGGAATSFNK